MSSYLKPKSTRLAKPRRGRSKPLAPLSAVQKVDHSWSVVKSDLNGVGVDFFTRVFVDVPAALDLFVGVLRLDVDELKGLRDDGAAGIARFVRENQMMKLHARLVVVETGRCVAGMHDMDVLVPRLRSLGRMHGAAGVMPGHYAIFFKHMIATVRDRVKKVDETAWDESTEEAWRTVGESMHRILSKPDATVGSVGGGRLTFWDAVCGGASFYTCIVTPLRMAGMVGFETSISLWNGVTYSYHDLKYYEMFSHFVLGLLDIWVVVVFVVELIGCHLLRQFKVARRVSMISSKKIQKARKASLFEVGVSALHSLRIHKSESHPISDVIFLLSYLFQHSNNLTTNGPSHENSITVGSHWMWALGMLRLVMIFRAVNFMQRLELAYTIRQHADGFSRSSMQVCRLTLSLAYASHLAACLYVLVARIELGPHATYGERPEELASSFFPDHTILGKENDVLTNYLRCVHFAFTNLAGIGNHESIPRTALECTFTLAVNALGATLYAFVTGLLLSMIEPAAERANQFGDSVATLSDFMTEVGMPLDGQERFIQGFIMTEISKSSQKQDVRDGPFASAPGENATSPAYPEECISNLPRHLQDELHTVALVDAMKRRQRAFRGCSDDFLNILASSLKPSIILLPGDYIVQEGQSSPSELLIVEQGKLEVLVGASHVHTFQRGDMLSFHWVGTSDKFLSNVSTTGTDSYSPLLLSQATAFASIRAMDRCEISTGLASISDRIRIRNSYPADWKQLEGVIDSVKSKKESKSIIENSMALIAPNNQLDDTKQIIPYSSGKKHRPSLTQRLLKLSPRSRRGRRASSCEYTV